MSIRRSSGKKHKKHKKRSSTKRNSSIFNASAVKKKLNELGFHWNDDGKLRRYNKADEIPMDMTSPTEIKKSKKMHPALTVMLGIFATAGITIGILLGRDPDYFEGTPILDDIGDKLEDARYEKQIADWIDSTSEALGYDVSPTEFTGVDINADYTHSTYIGISDAKLLGDLTSANRDLAALVASSHYVALSSSQLEQLSSLKDQIAELEIELDTRGVSY